MATPIHKNFWSNVKVGSPDECWPWMRSCITNGYGQFSKNGKMKTAHRYVYELTHGDIPSGIHICHSCDNPKCCNPAHLWAGTHAENMLDRDTKGRRNSEAAQAAGVAKLNPAVVAIIRQRRANGETLQSIADDYPVSIVTIFKIVHNKTWKGI